MLVVAVPRCQPVCIDLSLTPGTQIHRGMTEFGQILEPWEFDFESNGSSCGALYLLSLKADCYSFSEMLY